MRRAPQLIGVCALLAWGCGGSRTEHSKTPAPPSSNAHEVASNILRADYAGSAACATCHSELYDAWSRSPMHRMTRTAKTAEIRAPFDGRSYRFKNDTARLEQDGDTRFVSVSSAQFGDHVYRVTRVIGGRYREDFAGVEVAKPRADAAVIGEGHDELILPVSYVFATQSFRLKGYSVMARERPGMKAGGVWNQTCIFCHNTVPYFSDMLGALYGKGAPGYQGEVVDTELPAGRRSHFEIADGAAVARSTIDEMAFLGDSAPPDMNASRLTEVLGRGISATRDRFSADHLIEVGIGCESCHGGSRDHVLHPDRKPVFDIKSSLVRTASDRPPPPNAEPHAEAINRVCARCHQVLFSRYPYTWEGSQRSRDPGGSHITSGEGRDWLLGGCGTALACTGCHDPHAEDARAKLDGLATPQGNAVCTKCHAQYREPAALAAHAHHDATGAGASCVGCHMPKKNMGLGYALTRYHRIGSPTDDVRVERDRPLECALCHVEKSVEELVSTMERFWGHHYDRPTISKLYGGLDVNVLDATLARGKPHEKAVAMAVLGEHKSIGAADAIAHELTNAYPLLRYYAKAALSDVLGAPCSVDIDQEDLAIERDTEAWLRDTRARNRGAESAEPRRP